MFGNKGLFAILVYFGEPKMMGSCSYGQPTLETRGALPMVPLQGMRMEFGDTSLGRKAR
jgi:hypothetical protein